MTIQDITITFIVIGFVLIIALGAFPISETSPTPEPLVSTPIPTATPTPTAIPTATPEPAVQRVEKTRPTPKPTPEPVSTCPLPVPYSIGEVDSRFDLENRGISLRAVLTQVEKNWEAAMGRDVFSYQPGAKLTVNLVYGKRQKYYDRLWGLRRKVDAWEDGATIYPGLNRDEERKRLLEEYEEIERIAGTLPSGRHPVGRYNGTIQIYSYSSRDNLLDTIAHEMGHAIGIGHVKDKNAVMYELVNAQAIPNQTDVKAFKKLGFNCL